MKGIAALGNLEASFFRPWLLGNKRSQYGQIAGILVALLLGSLLLFRETEQMDAFMIRGIGFVWLGLFYLVTVRVSLSTYGGQLEWWLTLPYPRFSLVIGKALGLIHVGMQFILYMLIVMVAHCLIASSVGWMQPFAMQELIPVASSYLLYSLIGLPCAVALGILALLFQVGWWRIGIALLFCAAPMLMTGWMIASFFRDPYAIYASLALKITLIGWPLSLLICWLVASFGLKRLGNSLYATDSAPAGRQAASYDALQPSPLGNSAGGKLNPTSEITRQPIAAFAQRQAETLRAKAASQRRHPFWSLLALERTRYRWIGRRASFKAKCISYPLLLLLFVLGYWHGGDFEDMLFFQQLLLTNFYLVIMLYGTTALHADLQRGQGDWWLAFPHSRLMLLGARLLAYFTSMLGYFGLSLIVAAGGVMLRGLRAPIAAEHWHYIGSHLIYTALPTLIAAIVTISLFQIIPVVYKNSWLHLAIFPVYFSYYLGIRYLREWFYPTYADYRAGILTINDYWTHLFLLLGIGVPLGALCIVLGAKYLNDYLHAGRSGWFRRMR